MLNELLSEFSQHVKVKGKETYSTLQAGLRSPLRDLCSVDIS